MDANIRETTIRVHGTERTIRTEVGGKVKTPAQLEKAHTANVKAAVIELRAAKDIETGYPVGEANERARKATRLPSYVDHKAEKRPFPTPSKTAKPVPDYLVEVAPGEYVTRDVADEDGAAERVNEVLPGLSVERNTFNGDRSAWVLRHLPSVAAGDEKAHLGPGFKSRLRAREVALADLAHLDWTRAQDELTADPLTSATVRRVKFREMFQTSKKFAWAEDHMHKAEEELAALALPDAA